MTLFFLSLATSSFCIRDHPTSDYLLHLSPWVALSPWFDCSRTVPVLYLNTGTLLVSVILLLHCFVILLSSWLTCHILWKVYLKDPKTQFPSPVVSLYPYIPLYSVYHVTNYTSYIIYFLSLLILKLHEGKDAWVTWALLKCLEHIVGIEVLMEWMKECSSVSLV